MDTLFLTGHWLSLFCEKRKDTRHTNAHNYLCELCFFFTFEYVTKYSSIFVPTDQVVSLSHYVTHTKQLTFMQTPLLNKKSHFAIETQTHKKWLLVDQLLKWSCLHVNSLLSSIYFTLKTSIIRNVLFL